MKDKHKEKVYEQFKHLYEFSISEFEKCPWIRKQRVEDIIEKLKEEINELEEEIKKGEKRGSAKEVGDVFRDALLLLILISKKTGVKQSKILEYEIKKIEWRKPWIKEGGDISIQKAIKIWYERKKKEKDLL